MLQEKELMKIVDFDITKTTFKRKKDLTTHSK